MTPAVTSAAPPAPKPAPAGSLADVGVSITAGGPTTVRPGGPPMRLTVSMVNNGADIAQLGMVVSMGHCSCSDGGAATMPAGSMRMLDLRTGTWAEVPYNTEGTGMDYILENIVPPFALEHGQSVTYQLEVQLDSDPNSVVTEGKSTINVTPTDPANPMRYGFRYSKSLHITVEP
jgi:hypothetical protein